MNFIYFVSILFVNLVIQFEGTDAFIFGIAFNNNHASGTGVVTNNEDFRKPVHEQGEAPLDLKPLPQLPSNAKCTKVVHPSLLNLLYSEEEELKTSLNEQLKPNINSFTGFATPHYEDRGPYEFISGPVSSYFITTSVPDKHRWFCTFQSPIDHSTNTVAAAEPSLHFDWMVFLDGPNNVGNISQFSITVNASSERVMCASIEYEDDLNRTVIISPTISSVNADVEYAPEVAVWVDKIYVIDGSFSVQVCCLISRVEGTHKRIRSLPVTVDIMTIAKSSIEDVDINDQSGKVKNEYRMEHGTKRMQIPENVNASEYCVEIPFEKRYDMRPLVFTTVSYRNEHPNNALHGAPITHWVERINEISFLACVSKPRFFEINYAVARDAFVEYYVMSQNGIDDESTKKRHQSITHLTTTLTFPNMFILNHFAGEMDRKRDMYRGLYLAALETSTRFTRKISLSKLKNYGYTIVRPKMQLVIYTTYEEEKDLSAGVLLIEVVEEYTTTNNRLKYVASSNEDIRDFFTAMYPYPATPKHSEDRVAVEVIHSYGCIHSTFNKLQCSVEKCDEDYTGKMKIFRWILRESEFCPDIDRILECNVPPCEFPSHSGYKNINYVFIL